MVNWFGLVSQKLPQPKRTKCQFPSEVSLSCLKLTYDCCHGLGSYDAQHVESHPTVWSNKHMDASLLWICLGDLKRPWNTILNHAVEQKTPHNYTQTTKSKKHQASVCVYHSHYLSPTLSICILLVLCSGCITLHCQVIVKVLTCTPSELKIVAMEVSFSPLHDLWRLPKG